MQFLKLPAVVLAFGFAACGGAPARSTSPTTASTNANTTNDPSCPAAVPGTSVAVEDSANGAALVFVTTGDAAEVRRRAAAMASMHNEHHAAMGALPDGAESGGHAGHDMAGHAGHGAQGADAGSEHANHANHGGSHAKHAGGMIGVHSKASTSEIENGAKVLFVANGGDVAKLQSELRMHAQHLGTGTCAMGSS